MKWMSRRQSDNMEDRRVSGGKVALGGGAIGIIILLINLLEDKMHNNLLHF